MTHPAVRANSTEAIFEVAYGGAWRKCQKKMQPNISNAASCLSSVKSLSFEHNLFRFDRSKLSGGSSRLVAMADKAKKRPHWSNGPA